MTPLAVFKGHRTRWHSLVLTTALSLGLSGCSKEILFHDLTEPDANEIVGVLYSSSIEADKVVDAKAESFSVRVLSSDLPRAVGVLKALGLPRSPRANLNEVFPSTGFAPTPFEERVRYLFGLAQEIERTISMMTGVLETRVHVVTPDTDSKLEALQQSKASVYLSYDDRYDIDTLVPNIRQLVSDAIEGLNPLRVEVLAVPTRVDLKKISEVPIRRVLGVRVHKDDMAFFLIGVSIVLGLLTTSTALHLNFYRKRRARHITFNESTGRNEPAVE
jgi:type III secretion protein J